MKLTKFILAFIFVNSILTLIDQSMYIEKYYNIDHISTLFKDQYLKQTNKSFQKIVKGQMWGPNRQLLIILPVSFTKENCTAKINVIFKVDTGVGQTSLSNDVLYELFDSCKKDPRQQFQTLIQINNKKIIIFPKKYKYQTNLSILGANFLHRHNVKLIANYSQFSDEAFQLIFNSKEDQDL